jgi:hypothetical protein
MRNPFKKNNEAIDELYDVVNELFHLFAALQIQIKELREEVDFLVDELDD